LRSGWTHQPSPPAGSTTTSTSTSVRDKNMAQFKRGDTVRTKGGGGPNMTVDGYSASGESSAPTGSRENASRTTSLRPRWNSCRPYRHRLSSTRRLPVFLKQGTDLPSL
jgi:hypothetical protein